MPRFIDLSTKAQENATKGALGGIRAAIAIKYASEAANGNAAFPASIYESLFGDSKIPAEPYSNNSGVTVTSGPPTADGTGWLYDSSTGQVWVNDSDYASY